MKLGVATGHRVHTMFQILSLEYLLLWVSGVYGLSCTRETSVHRSGVSTKEGCPRGGVLLQLLCSNFYLSINKWQVMRRVRQTRHKLMDKVILYQAHMDTGEMVIVIPRIC